MIYNYDKLLASHIAEVIREKMAVYYLRFRLRREIRVT